MLKTTGLKSRSSQQPDAIGYAEKHACKLLLNCYIREMAPERSTEIRLDRQQGKLSIDFPASGGCLQAELAYVSATGEHEYRSLSWVADLQHEAELLYTEGAIEPSDYAAHLRLLRAIIAELHDGQALTDERAKRFHERVDNSLRNTALYMEHAIRHGKLLTDYRSSEQALVVGHPFHPFPKSTVGFRAEDVLKYSPELGSAFALCYVAVRSDVYKQDWAVEHYRERIVEGLRRHLLRADTDSASQQHLNRWLRDENYELLPMHPWQYGYIQSQPMIRQYIDERKLILLGQCGPLAYPTSSVRTVFLPELNCNIKLPLHIQITNLLRVNSAEQMTRTLAATRYVLEQQCFADEPYTHIACEMGTATCSFDADEWTSLFTVAYRPIEFDVSQTYVLSALVESALPSGRSQLYTILERIATSSENDKVLYSSSDIRSIAERWLRLYLERSLLPIMRAGERLGIHFEAHLQNTLVTLKDGWPQHFIIRDLEGVSVERRIDIEQVGDDILFYTVEAARARTAYYFIVNHLGSLLHVLARDTDCTEEHYWHIATTMLEDELQRQDNELIRYMLNADYFQAKQNLRSCLHGHGDTPNYVHVRNMLKPTGE